MITACGLDVETQSCKAICGTAYDCCSKVCVAPCHECKHRSRLPGQETETPVTRKIHRPHKCDRDLLCGHSCHEDCEVGHECGICKQERVKTCAHAQKSRAKCCEVKKPCESFRKPVIARHSSDTPDITFIGKERCDWKCEHEKSCRLPCGSVSHRRKGIGHRHVLTNLYLSLAIDFRVTDVAKRTPTVDINVHPVSQRSSSFGLRSNTEMLLSVRRNLPQSMF